MPRYRHLLIATILIGSLVSPAPARAADPAPAGVLDLIPEDAAFALAVKNLAELRDKGEKFVKASDLRLGKNERPSALFDKIFEGLDLKKGFNEKGSVALVLSNFTKLGLDKIKPFDGLNGFEVLLNLVLVVPIDDRDAILRKYELRADQVKGGKPVPVPHLGPDIVVALQGNYFYISGRAKAITVLLKSKPVGATLSEAQRAVMSKSDIAFMFGFKALGPLGEELQKGMKEAMTNPRDNVDNDVLRQFAGLVGDMRYLVAGLNLDDGFAMNMIASFPKEGTSVKLLEALRGGPGYSDLTGLPNVEPLLAYAAKGDGTRNVHMARALLKMLLDQWLGIAVQLTKAERDKFTTAFEKVYRDWKGSRLAVYRTDEKEAEKIGAMAAVLVIDTEAGEAHLDQWPAFIEVVNGIKPWLTKEGRLSVPKLAHQAKAERIDGLRVDRVKIEVPKLPDEVRRQYQKLLGPDWDTVRLAAQGKHVVVLIGSDLARLRETLANLKAGKKGLAGRKSVEAALAKLAPERKLEFHFNVRDYAAFAEDKVDKKGTDLTSFALGVEPERIHLEIRAPASEARAIIRLLGLAKE